MKKIYTYAYIKTVTGTVSVRADSDEEADSKAYEQLEKTRDESFVEKEESSEVTLLDLKDVEPVNSDDHA
jgi:hypothetical protein